MGDAPIGAAFLGLALAVLWHIRDFPPAPGQPYGPALFPGLIAGGLALASLLLIVAAWRGRAAPVQSDVRVAETEPGGGRSSADTDRRIIPFVATVLALVGYVVCVNRLGFIPAAFLMLCILFAAYRVRRSLILPVAAAATLIVHTAFYKLLKVPLPWGLLSGMTW